MTALKPVSLFQRVFVAFLVGMLFLTNSAFVHAQGQTSDPYAKQLSANGERSQLPQALAPAEKVTAANIIKDPSFEASYNSMLYWGQYSENFGTPLCIVADCGTGAGTAGPRTGSVWAWFGGVDFSIPGTSNPEGAQLSQSVTVPSCGAKLQFYFWIGRANAGSGADDFFNARLGGKQIFLATAAQKNLYPSYTLVTVHITPGTFTPGQQYLYFQSVVSDQLVNFNLDDITLIPNCLTISGNAGVPGATISYTGGSTTTKSDGSYTFNIPPGWSGTVTPSKTNYTFSPANRTYSNVTSNKTGQNYTATLITHTISGNAGVANAVLNYTGGSTASDVGGNYSFTVVHGWSGTVTPYLTGYLFDPTKRTYSNVTTNQMNQDYTATRMYEISGNVGVGGATLSYTDDTSKTVTSQADGSYLLFVPENWSGTVTPSHPCYTFNPIDRSYTNVGGDSPFQDYTPSLDAGAGCSDVDVKVRGVILLGRFGLPAGDSTRASFTGINDGAVKIESTNAVPLIAAERLIYKVNNVNTSFTEMMGLPSGQLDKIYWLPWYNNVDLNTELRIGNASGSTATVHVYIGAAEMTDSPFTIAAQSDTRRTYIGINNGPVRIVSDQDIVATERVIYKVNGVDTSYSELMALPNSQLDTTYWLPWYNNVNLDTQLRFANVSAQTANVRVYIGGAEMPGSPFTLGAGESTRRSFIGVDDGPVQIVSDQNIVAAERVIYKINNIPTSFTEMMALPNSQLDTTYWLPWYNNVNLDTQLRFANVSGSTATVHVYIGGVEMDGSPFTLLPGESTRQSFTGIDAGPVQIVSDVPIVAAERVIYKVNGVNTSFSEMMALPNTLLDTTYWFPLYNNVGLDTQLRFGIP